MKNIEKALSLFDVKKVETIYNNEYYVIWTSKNGKYNISLYENSMNEVRIKIDDSWFSDYPLMYDHYSYCVYDYPEHFPKYIKDKVDIVARKLRKKGLF